MRLLKVQGKGRVSMEPDLVTLSFSVEAKAREYEKSIIQLNTRSDDLRASMIASGLDKTRLKTTSFNVRIDQQRVNGEYVFAGYITSHLMHIELPMEKSLINKVLRHVAQGQSGAEVSLAFSVKDQDALRKKVLAQAVTTAMDNAATLAAAAGVSLGKLIQMDHGSEEVHIYNRDIRVLAQASIHEANYDLDVEPADVSTEDSVTLTFEIFD